MEKNSPLHSTQTPHKCRKSVILRASHLCTISNRTLTFVNSRKPSNTEAKPILTGKYKFAGLRLPLSLYLCAGPDTGGKCTKGRKHGDLFLHTLPQTGLKTQSCSILDLRQADILRITQTRNCWVRKGALGALFNPSLEIFQKGSLGT